jgi:acetolactate synthase-1/2/3 large subunit
MPDTDHGGVLAARALQETGIHNLFALPGGHILPLLDGARQVGLELIDTRHEENAVLMAGGHALATGRPAAAGVTAGPGLTNALPGIAEINASGIPAVVIAGRTPLSLRGRGAVQDVDQMAIVAPVTKWRAECVRTDRIPGMVAEAVHQARTGSPGVAYLEIPQDVFSAAAAYEAPPWPVGHSEPGRSRPADADVAAAIEMLAGAERPAVLAGSGAFFSGAGTALARFADQTGIPVITTAAARGLLPDDHPVCAGSLVHGGVTLVSADVALVLGSRFNANIVYGGPPLFGVDQKVIQVDVRPENTGGPRRPDLVLAGDVAATLEVLADAWEAPAGRFTEWLADAKSAAAASLETWAGEGDSPASGIHPGRLAAETGRFAAAMGDHTFVSDGGDSVVWGLALSHSGGPGTNLTIGSAMGTLGVGTPFAVAAKAARPAEPVFLFTGDGAFGMSAMELDTAARHELPIVVVVVDNGGWGDTRHAQAAAYGEEASTGELSGMQYELLGSAVGGHGERITTHEEVRPALERAARAAAEGKVAVIAAVCDPDAVSAFMSNVKGLDLM